MNDMKSKNAIELAIVQPDKFDTNTKEEMLHKDTYVNIYINLSKYIYQLGEQHGD